MSEDMSDEDIAERASIETGTIGRMAREIQRRRRAEAAAVAGAGPTDRLTDQLAIADHVIEAIGERKSIPVIALVVADLILAREQAAVARSRRETIEEVFRTIWSVRPYDGSRTNDGFEYAITCVGEHIRALAADRATEGETGGGGRKPTWRIGSDCASECSDPGSESCLCYASRAPDAGAAGGSDHG